MERMNFRKLIFLMALLFLAIPLLNAAGPVYILLWFDTEDYVDPASDDAALRIATDLSSLGVRATFKLVGEKARVLEQRGRIDVIRALSHHAIGFHSNFHSIQPTPSVYLRRLGYLEGAQEFQRREQPGALDIRRIFGVTPICYGQPGSSWAPQANLALRRMNIPVYLDEASHVGIGGQPFWYGGLLYIFNMVPNLYRPTLDTESGSYQKLDEMVQRLAASGGGVISSYFHPTEFINSEFWDAANFSAGALPERSQWKRPRAKSNADAERGFRILHDYVSHASKLPGVQFVTAQDLLQIYAPAAPPTVGRTEIAQHLAHEITFLNTPAGALSPADMLQQLLGMKVTTVDGPVSRGVTTLQTATIRKDLFEKAKRDAADFIATNHRLPAEVFVGVDTLSLADFTATLAGAELSTGEVHRMTANTTFEKYFATDAKAAFQWPIHPDNFAAPELMELAKLQGWTLKPARLR
jgi:hypothetical protein